MSASLKVVVIFYSDALSFQCKLSAKMLHFHWSEAGIRSCGLYHCVQNHIVKKGQCLISGLVMATRSWIVTPGNVSQATRSYEP